MMKTTDLDHTSFDEDLKQFLLEEPLRKMNAYQSSYNQPFVRESREAARSTLIGFRKSADCSRPVKTQQGHRRNINLE